MRHQKNFCGARCFTSLSDVTTHAPRAETVGEYILEKNQEVKPENSKRIKKKGEGFKLQKKALEIYLL